MNELTKKCVMCNPTCWDGSEILKEEEFSIYIDHGALVYSTLTIHGEQKGFVKVNFCPNCGRKLA